MLHSYRAILDGDRIRWDGPAPEQQGPLSVDVTVRGPAPATRDKVASERERGRLMAAALERLAAARVFSCVSDAAAWQ